jgi:hypothetical protein
MVDALYLTHNLLVGAGIREHTKLIVSGKIASGFGMFRAFAMGADICNSARGMMFALGCIQSLKCHTNKCPTGVATQDRKLQYGLDVPDKADRVYNFHKKTIEAAMDLVAASGHKLPTELTPDLVLVRGPHHTSASYAQLNPPLQPGELINGGGTAQLKETWERGLKLLRGGGEGPPSLLVVGGA